MKGQVVKLLSFAGQEAKLIVCKLLYNKRENKFSKFFIEDIQNIISIIFLYYRSTNENKGILKDISLNWHSNLVFSIIKMNCKDSYVNADLNEF